MINGKSRVFEKIISPPVRVLGHALDLPELGQNLRLQKSGPCLGSVELDGSFFSGHEVAEALLVEEVLPAAGRRDRLRVAHLCLEGSFEILKQKFCLLLAERSKSSVKHPEELASNPCIFSAQTNKKNSTREKVYEVECKHCSSNALEKSSAPFGLSALKKHIVLIVVECNEWLTYACCQSCTTENHEFRSKKSNKGEGLQILPIPKNVSLDDDEIH